MKNTYSKNNQQIAYEITYKPIKHTYFRIKNQTLIITTNRHSNEATIMKFVDQKFDQFFKRINEQVIQESHHEIFLWGKKYDLIITFGQFSYHIFEDQVFIKTKLKDIDKIKKTIYKFEMIQFIEKIKHDFTKHLQNHHINWVSYKLKYMSSKYGSYHRKKQEITLNTYLSKLDPTYLIYVLNHEYAHTKVFNHQKKFYHLLEEMYPNYKQIQKDLKKIAII